MKIKRLSVTLATCLLATTAWAQSASKPLNLKLPSNLPAASSTAAVASSSSVGSTGNPTRTATAPSSQPAAASTAPGVYYGDTSGRIENDTADSTPQCDDSKYNQMQMHGSVSTGVVSASHGGSGSWSGGAVNLSQAFGSCDHPTGGVSISIGGETGHFHH